MGFILGKASLTRRIWLGGVLALICVMGVLLTAQSAYSLQIYYGSKSGESGMCPAPGMEASCTCTEDYVAGFIYRERCVSMPGENEQQVAAGGSGNNTTDFSYPRVRVAYYLWGSGVKVRHLGVGEGAWIKALRHCARLTFGDKRQGEEGYNPDKNYGNNLAGDSSAPGGQLRVPLRLCVFEDAIDPTDTNGKFSPFHLNTSQAEKQIIESQMKANTFGDQKWLGTGSRVVSGFDNLIGALTGASFNLWVPTIVGCAPVPLAPMPPPFCDDCRVLPKVPDPVVSLKEGTSFESPELSVQLASYQLNARGDRYELTAQEPVTMAMNERIQHEGEEYFAEICTDGTEICFSITGAQPRVIHRFARPDFMPLPTVEDISDNIDFPTMRVTLGAGARAQTAELSINEPGKECATLHDVELCAVRECLSRDIETGKCLTLATEVCLDGYYPQPFEVPGYHPSKGVLVDKVSGEVAGDPPNSTDGSKRYFDADHYHRVLGNVQLPPNVHHRAFTPSELGLCIGGAWRWPEIVDTFYETPGVETVEVDPACTRVKATIIGAGAAGAWENGCHDLSCDFAGGAGGYVEAEFDLQEGDEVKVDIGKGGTTGGAGNRSSNNGGNSRLLLNGQAIITALGAQGRNGGATSFVNTRNMTIVKRVTGQTTNGLPTSSVAVAGGHAEGQIEQPASACSGSGTAAIAPLGGGGCSKDDAPGAFGLGGNGGVALECLAFAETTASEQPMPTVEGEPVPSVPVAEATPAYIAASTIVPPPVCTGTMENGVCKYESAAATVPPAVCTGFKFNNVCYNDRKQACSSIGGETRVRESAAKDPRQKTVACCRPGTYERKGKSGRGGNRYYSCTTHFDYGRLCGSQTKVTVCTRCGPPRGKGSKYKTITHNNNCYYDNGNYKP